MENVHKKKLPIFHTSWEIHAYSKSSNASKVLLTNRQRMYRKDDAAHGLNAGMAAELNTGAAGNVISVALAKELCEDFYNLRPIWYGFLTIILLSDTCFYFLCIVFKKPLISFYSRYLSTSTCGFIGNNIF